MAGGNPKLAIQIIANTAELIANLNAGRGAVEAYGPSIAKITEGWQRHSALLIENAAKITAALQQVGVSTLTAADAARSLSTLDSAIAQLKQTGQAIPPLMQETATQLRAVASATAATAAPMAHMHSDLTKADEYMKLFAGDATMGMHGLGTGIKETAAAMTEAVQRMGGAANLTQADQARVNQTVTQAIAHYQALGQTAPAAMVALQTATAGAVQPMSALQRHVEQLGGGSTIANAMSLTQAIGSIGGASRLTASEQATVNRTVSEAIAKYAALGQTAPAAMVALQKETATVAEATTAVSTKTSALSAIWAQLGPTIIAAFSVRAIVGFVSSVVEAASHLQDLHEQTGISTDALQDLKMAADLSGGSLENITRSIGMMAKALVGGDQAASEAVQRLGLNVQDLIAMGPEASFRAIAMEISKIPDPMLKSAEAAAIFKRAGIELIPTMQAIADGSAESVKYSKEQIIVLDALGDTYTRLKNNAAPWLANLLLEHTAIGRVVAQTLLLQTAQGNLAKAGGDLSALIPPLTARQQQLGLGLASVALSAEDAATATSALKREYENVVAPANAAAAAALKLRASFQIPESTPSQIAGLIPPLRSVADEFEALLNSMIPAGSYLDVLASQMQFQVAPAMTSAKDAIDSMIMSMQEVPAPPPAASQWASLGQSLQAELVKIPATLAQAFTGGGDIMGAIQAISTSIGAKIGEHIAGALSFTGPMGQAIGGAIGSLLGPVVGMIADMLDHVPEDIMRTVGRGWGVNITAGLMDQIAADVKGGMSEVAATLMHLGEIVAEAGGLSPANLDMFMGRLRDTFVMIETHQLTIGQGTQILDENWAAFAAAATDANGRISESLKEIIRLNEIFGTQSQEIAAWQAAQGASAVAGFVAVVAGTAGAVAGYAAVGQAVRDAQAAFDALVLASTATEAELAAAAGAVTQALEAQSDAAVLATRELSDLGIQAVASFAAAVASGAPMSEALASIHPALETLRQSYIDLGMDVNNVALSALMMQDTIASGNPALISAISGLAAQMVALDNLGLMNAETFAAMQRTGTDAYVRLQAAAEAAGGSTRDALIPMQDYLHRAAEQAELLGVPLDENTQSMIAQSQELGIWEETGVDAAAALTASMDVLVNKITELIDQMVGLPGLTSGATTEVSTQMTGVQTSVGNIQTQMDATDWAGWAADGIAAASNVAMAIDTISFGSSPGGIIEIREQLESARDSVEMFADEAISRFDDVARAVTSLGDDIREEVSELELERRRLDVLMDAAPSDEIRRRLLEINRSMGRNLVLPGETRGDAWRETRRITDGDIRPTMSSGSHATDITIHVPVLLDGRMITEVVARQTLS